MNNSIDVWSTSNCNLRCKYCYESIQNKNKGNFSESLITDLINFILSGKFNIVNFHGGEPLVNFNMIKTVVDKLVKYNSNFKFGFTTNGTILSKDIEEYLNLHSELFENLVSISIDGNIDTMKCTRNFSDNDFNSLLINANKFKNIFAEIRIRMTVIPERINYLYSDIVFLFKKGFKTIAVSLDLLNSEWNDETFASLEEQYEDIIRFCTVNKNLKVSLIDELFYLKEKKSCQLGTNVYIDGNIYPCLGVVGDDKFLIGNIKNGINSDLKNQFYNICNKSNKFCELCNNKNFCMYERCKFINYISCGDFYKPPMYGCAFENLKIKLLYKYSREIQEELKTDINNLNNIKL